MATSPVPASSSSSAIRSRRSTGSAAPTSAPTGACATQLEARGGRVLQLTTSFRSVPAIQRFVNAAFGAEMTGERGDAAGRLRAAGAVSRPATTSQPAVVALPVPEPYGAERRRAEGVGEGDRGVAARRGRRVHRLAGRREERLDGRRAAGRRRRDARADPAAPHRHPVPPLRQLRRGRHARLRRRDRGARHPAPARRRQGVPRPRRGRDHSRGARRDRVAGRRAVGVRDAEGLALRDRRRAPARVPAAVRRVSSVPGSEGARRQFRPGARAHRRADRAPRRRSPTRCGCCSSCTAAATTGRSPTRSAGCSPRRARTSGFILRPAGEQALANVLHVAELARQYEAGGGISFRGFIDELRDAAADRGGRGADSRGGQRRRPADDRAQGQGARVPGRHPRRPDLPA